MVRSERIIATKLLRLAKPLVPPQNHPLSRQQSQFLGTVGEKVGKRRQIGECLPISNRYHEGMETTAANLIDEDDAVRLRNAVMRLARDLRKTANQEGLTATQSSVLATVVRENEVPLSKLADNEGLNPTMLSRVIAHLEENDYVRREKDPIDRRAFVVQPTTQGRRLMQRLRDRRTSQLLQRISHLDEASALQLVRALPALEQLAGVEDGRT
jgi:DNA-binding MarR family transcriptional regulator